MVPRWVAWVPCRRGGDTDGRNQPERKGYVRTKTPLTPEQEYEYYAEPGNQQPQGPPQRRQPRLSAIVPVRFPPELLDEIRRRAEADDRSLSPGSAAQSNMSFAVRAD